MPTRTTFLVVLCRSATSTYIWSRRSSQPLTPRMRRTFADADVVDKKKCLRPRSTLKPSRGNFQDLDEDDVVDEGVIEDTDLYTGEDDYEDSDEGDSDGGKSRSRRMPKVGRRVVKENRDGHDVSKATKEMSDVEDAVRSGDESLHSITAMQALLDKSRLKLLRKQQLLKGRKRTKPEKPLNERALILGYFGIPPASDVEEEEAKRKKEEKKKAEERKKAEKIKEEQEKLRQLQMERQFKKYEFRWDLKKVPIKVSTLEWPEVFDDRSSSKGIKFGGGSHVGANLKSITMASQGVATSTTSSLDPDLEGVMDLKTIAMASQDSGVASCRSFSSDQDSGAETASTVIAMASQDPTVASRRSSLSDQDTEAKTTLTSTVKCRYGFKRAGTLNGRTSVPEQLQRSLAPYHKSRFTLFTSVLKYETINYTKCPSNQDFEETTVSRIMATSQGSRMVFIKSIPSDRSLEGGMDLKSIAMASQDSGVHLNSILTACPNSQAMFVVSNPSRRKTRVFGAYEDYVVRVCIMSSLLNVSAVAYDYCYAYEDYIFSSVMSLGDFDLHLESSLLPASDTEDEEDFADADVVDKKKCLRPRSTLKPSRGNFQDLDEDDVVDEGVIEDTDLYTGEDDYEDSDEGDSDGGKSRSRRMPKVGRRVVKENRDGHDVSKATKEMSDVEDAVRSGDESLHSITAMQALLDKSRLKLLRKQQLLKGRKRTKPEKPLNERALILGYFGIPPASDVEEEEAKRKKEEKKKAEERKKAEKIKEEQEKLRQLQMERQFKKYEFRWDLKKVPIKVSTLEWPEVFDDRSSSKGIKFGGGSHVGANLKSITMASQGVATSTTSSLDPDLEGVMDLKTIAMASQDSGVASCRSFSSDQDSGAETASTVIAMASQDQTVASRRSSLSDQDTEAKTTLTSTVKCRYGFKRAGTLNGRTSVPEQLQRSLAPYHKSRFTLFTCVLKYETINYTKCPSNQDFEETTVSRIMATSQGSRMVFIKSIPSDRSLEGGMDLKSIAMASQDSGVHLNSILTACPNSQAMFVVSNPSRRKTRVFGAYEDYVETRNQWVIHCSTQPDPVKQELVGDGEEAVTDLVTLNTKLLQTRQANVPEFPYDVTGVRTFLKNGRSFQRVDHLKRFEMLRNCFIKRRYLTEVERRFAELNEDHQIKMLDGIRAIHRLDFNSQIRKNCSQWWERQLHKLALAYNNFSGTAGKWKSSMWVFLKIPNLFLVYLPFCLSFPQVTKILNNLTGFQIFVYIDALIYEGIKRKAMVLSDMRERLLQKKSQSCYCPILKSLIGSLDEEHGYPTGKPMRPVVRDYLILITTRRRPCRLLFQWVSSLNISILLPVNMSGPRKLKCLSIGEKFNLIKELEKGQLSKKEVAKKFDIKPSTLSGILKNKEDVLKAFETESPNRKRKRGAEYDDIEEALIVWFEQARQNNIPISGPIIQEKALSYAKLFNNDQFQASDGWLNNFKKRHGIVFRKLCGESADVSNDICDEWKSKLSTITSAYKPDEIYNADETDIESDGKPTNINILHAIRMIDKSWRKVKKETIVNCFLKSVVHLLITKKDMTRNVLTNMMRTMRRQVLLRNKMFSTSVGSQSVLCPKAQQYSLGYYSRIHEKRHISKTFINIMSGYFLIHDDYRFMYPEAFENIEKQFSTVIDNIVSISENVQEWTLLESISDSDPLENDNSVKDNETQIVDDNKVEDPATNSTNKPPTIFVSDSLIPEHQFGFRSKHATTEQVNRLTAEIRIAFENKLYCNAVFLDVSQAFDRVWHKGLIFKLKALLPTKLSSLLESYLCNRTFQVKIGDSLTDPYPCEGGVPQGSVLGPTLYLLFTADFPAAQNVFIATFADDTAVLTSSSCHNEASSSLQTHLDKVSEWCDNWRLKTNETKSNHITFTLRKSTCPTIYFKGASIPQVDQVKYLGMHLDRRLTWRPHIWAKRKQLGLQLRKMNWLLGPKSQLSLDNKILLYLTILKPIWSYGIQLWGTASTLNIEILERFQSKTLRCLVQAPWYIRNEQICRELKIDSVKSEIRRFHTRYKTRLKNPPNQLAKELLTRNTCCNSRLKKYKFDL
ncbi:unnamed protein product [Trichogramma brassicae]|uniref:Uncharacterized protein n=1 Tax=Trichogramma brassicae TaxID=86971 RepID=A0A6H5J2A8_9HYME|nr:unnamed protein product [Trichogramma brassicae]